MFPFPFPMHAPNPAAAEKIKAAVRTVEDWTASPEKRVQAICTLKDAGNLGWRVPAPLPPAQMGAWRHCGVHCALPLTSLALACLFPQLVIPPPLPSTAATDGSPQDLIQSGAVEALVCTLTAEWPAGGALDGSQSVHDVVAQFDDELLRRAPPSVLLLLLLLLLLSSAAIAAAVAAFCCRHCCCRLTAGRPGGEPLLGAGPGTCTFDQSVASQPPAPTLHPSCALLLASPAPPSLLPCSPRRVAALALAHIKLDLNMMGMMAGSAMQQMGARMAAAGLFGPHALPAMLADTLPRWG